MKILMVVAYFVPEIGSAAHIYFDLAKTFVKKGHEVDVITSYPRGGVKPVVFTVRYMHAGVISGHAARKMYWMK